MQHITNKSFTGIDFIGDYYEPCRFGGIVLYDIGTT